MAGKVISNVRPLGPSAHSLAGISSLSSPESRKFLNDVLYSVETAYRGIAAQEVEAATAGVAPTDYVLLVDGSPAPKARIRSARLFDKRGIRVTGKGDSKSLFAAWQLAMGHIDRFALNKTPLSASHLRARQRYGRFKDLLETRIDGRIVLSPSPSDFEGAVLVEIYSRAAHAGPIEAIYDGRIFGGAARAASNVGGIGAVLKYGEPDAYNQVKRPFVVKRALRVPVVRITFAENLDVLRDRRRRR